MPREPMPDVIVLLPGIAGSVLRKDGKDVWALSGEALQEAIRSLGRSLKDLMLVEDPPDREDLGDGVTADRLIGDVHLIPYLWKIDGYSKVAETIKATFDVQPGRNYFEFPYDWRRDNRVAANRLDRASKTWLADWRTSSGKADARLILIAHSMGGLVSRYFIEVLEGWKDTQALITFGTPYRGSINALEILANGFRKGPAGLLDLSALVRSLTSVYQLLPTYRCFDPGNGTLVRVGETSEVPNLDSQKAAAALEFHREIEQAVEARRRQDAKAYEIYPIVGIEQPTSQSARRAGGGVEILTTYEGKDLKGDGTVPRVSATPLELSEERREMFAATRHASLQNADAILTNLHGLISNLYLDLGAFKAPPTPPRVRLGLEIEDAYWHDEPVAVRVLPGAVGVTLHATIADTKTGTEVARQPLRVHSDRQSAEFRPLPAGTYRITVAGDAGVEPVQDVFAVFVPEPQVRGLGPFLVGKEGLPPQPKAANGEPREAASEPRAQPGPPTPAPAARVDAVLSAQGPGEIRVGEQELVDVQIEIADGAVPLAHAVTASIGTAEKIVVILAVDTEILQIVGPRLLLVDPPTAGTPRRTTFTVQGKAAGSSSIDVMFRQGASDLGTVSFAVSVVAGSARSDPVHASATAEPRHEDDDEVVLLLVEEDREGESIRYRYDIYSTLLNLHYQEFESAPIQPRGGSASATSMAYVTAIYRQLVERVLASQTDVRVFAREVRAIGTDMCRQLFNPELLRILWAHRSGIKVVRVTSKEPYIPWELLCLTHPDTDEADDRFLAEYGLVRTLRGPALPRDLPGRSWRYLVGSYPNNSHTPVGADEVDFLTTKLPPLGMDLRPMRPDPEEVLSALSKPDFDVLHISCHGSTELDDIEQTRLIISDRRLGAKVEPVVINARTVRGEAKLKERRPIVFLSACETGQQAPSLTDWGGWPKAFCGSGAGAFVGTSWAVREGPAAAFSNAFYTALLEGSTLAEAASTARLAAKQRGDASWLAFVVYGHPMARMSRA